MSDAEEARQDAEQFDCAVAGEVADLEGRSELSMPGCQANASKVIEAILTIAREEAVDGKLDLERLEALASAVRSKEVRSFYSANYKHCQSANNLTPFTPYREMFLGRVISSPLEALLFATPPVMLRSQLPALFAAVKAMIGDQVFDRLDDTARVVYEEYISKMGRDFVWDPFYADPRIVAIFCETVVRLAEPFAVYEQDARSFHRNHEHPGRGGRWRQRWREHRGIHRAALSRPVLGAVSAGDPEVCRTAPPRWFGRHRDPGGCR